jgi:hypothetical protein
MDARNDMSLQYKASLTCLSGRIRKMQLMPRLCLTWLMELCTQETIQLMPCSGKDFHKAYHTVLPSKAVAVCFLTSKLPQPAPRRWRAGSGG